MKVVILNGNYRASQASGGHDFVARLQLVKHGLPFLLAALLRHDQQKIEDAKNKNERSKTQPSCRTAA